MTGTDEFEIKATGPNMPERIWTRDDLSTAKFIADRIVNELGYTQAVVINTYGGIRSNPIYTATPEVGIDHPES